MDEIIWESADGETYTSFPVLRSRIHAFIETQLKALTSMSEKEIIDHRYKKFRALGTFSELDESQRMAAVDEAIEKKTPPKRLAKPIVTPTLLVKHLAEEARYLILMFLEDISIYHDYNAQY